MLCPEASELISLRLDKALPASDEEALQEHLASCEACRAVYREFERVDDLFQGVAFAAPPPLLAQRIMGKVHRRNRWLAVVRRGALALLGVVIIAALGLAPLLTALGAVLDNPSLVSALVGLALRVAEVVSAVLRAFGLIAQGVFASPSIFVIVAYCSLALGLLSVWLRLVAPPATSAAAK